MTDLFKGIEFTTVKDRDQAMQLVGRLFDTAQPTAVFGEPVTVGEHTIITASEAKVSMGFGYGGGGGLGSEAAERETEGEAGEGEPTVGFGSGGGGGGASSGRPVAAIIAGPDGVRVEPIVDVTTLVLAFLAAIGGLFMMRNRLRRMAAGQAASQLQ